MKSTFQHPVGAVFFLLGKLLRFAMYFLFVSYLLGQTKFLAGFTMTQTLIFFLTYNIIDSLSQLLFREVYRFRPLVVNGELDTILVKPYHPFTRILVGGIDILDLVTILLYGGLLVYFLGQVELTALNLITYGALIVNALLIATGFHIMVLALGIITTEVDHAIMIYRDVTRIGTLPIDIYKEPIRSIFTFLLPVGIMITFPTKALFSLLPWQLVGLSFAVGGGVLLLSLMLWNSALKKYQSWGG